jgi:macrolide transport system ATP-binding/permease protein
VNSLAPVLELVDVTREFDGGSIMALDDVSIAIRRGESVAIVGPSGSGKSTLLNILAGLDRPTRGSVRVLGHQAGERDWAELRSRHIGIVFQNFHLLATLSAIENVEAALLGRVAKASARRERARSLLAQLGLERRATQPPARLSGGERQRVAIARALANGPEILLADEPTGSLDRSSSQIVMKTLLAAHRERGHALVIVTHDPDVASNCGREIEIVDGRITRDSLGGAAPS